MVFEGAHHQPRGEMKWWNKRGLETMSRLADYSKFDNIDTDSDDEGEADTQSAARSEARTQQEKHNDEATPHRARGSTTAHPTIKDRYVFSHGGRRVYEWEQTLDDVTVCIEAPIDQLPSQRAASFIVVDIEPTRLRVGLRGADRYFIDEATFDKVKVQESSWYLDDGRVITIVLAKAFRGQTWEGVLRGHQRGDTSSGDGDEAGSGRVSEKVDPVTKQAMQRTLLLERFQEENPGFDFRDATFNGEAPDPRTFMGGVGYNN